MMSAYIATNERILVTFNPREKEWGICTKEWFLYSFDCDLSWTRMDRWYVDLFCIISYALTAEPTIHPPPTLAASSSCVSLLIANKLELFPLAWMMLGGWIVGWMDGLCVWTGSIVGPGVIHSLCTTSSDLWMLPWIDPHLLVINYPNGPNFVDSAELRAHENVCCVS